jgi:pimeloyl-ACP methyl ester carboxylesterase
MSPYRVELRNVLGHDISVLRAGSGTPTLVLHDELGFPGWLGWINDLAASCEVHVILQPGFGVSPRIEWVRNFRDLAGVYNGYVRSLDAGPANVIGFSAGGYIAAEMAATCPDLLNRAVLVAPLGCRPADGELRDFLAMSVRNHVAATVSRPDAPEFAKIYGGEITPEQFELFEDARAETARLGWEPFMYDPALPSLLGGIGALPGLVIWGSADLIVPKGAVDVFADAWPNSQVVILDDVGHRPEIEAPGEFMRALRSFLELDLPSVASVG